MQFTEIDMAAWPRAQVFYYFSQMAPTSYSLTMDIDVTELQAALKTKNLKFFPTYLWLVTKSLNRQPEFKLAYQDGRLGYYNTLTPLYASFHEDDKTFSLMWTEFHPDYRVFYDRYMENKALYSENHGILAQPQTPPPANAYTVSTLPWITFNHFAVHTHENKPYYFPSAECGKIYEKGGRSLLPLSMTCHHAATDGYHLKVFLEDLQQEMILLIEKELR